MLKNGFSVSEDHFSILSTEPSCHQTLVQKRYVRGLEIICVRKKSVTNKKVLKWDCFYLNKRLSYPCGSQFLEVVSETVDWIISLECCRWIHVSDKLWALSALESFLSLFLLLVAATVSPLRVFMLLKFPKY